MAELFKLGRLKGDAWVEHSHPPHFARSANRIVATAPGGDATIFRKLVQYLEPPIFLLYVLHTSRGEGALGRYQSPSLSRVELDSFLDCFSDFFARDSRFDLWAYSPEMKATIVWDRHNLIFGYGPLQDFEDCLLGLGFRPGKPSMEFEHTHNYHPECDSAATQVLEYFHWLHAPLKAEDEQFHGPS